MPRGGKRANSGPKAKPKAPPIADKEFAGRVLARIRTDPQWHVRKQDQCRSDEELALFLMSCGDRKIEADTFHRLVEKRDGKAMHIVNHLHDKPIEVNHTFSLAEVIRQARLRVSSK